MEENFSLKEDDTRESGAEHSEADQQNEKPIDYEALSRDKKEREATEQVEQEHDSEQAEMLLSGMGLEMGDIVEEEQE